MLNEQNFTTSLDLTCSVRVPYGKQNKLGNEMEYFLILKTRCIAIISQEHERCATERNIQNFQQLLQQYNNKNNINNTNNNNRTLNTFIVLLVDGYKIDDFCFSFIVYYFVQSENALAIGESSEGKEEKRRKKTATD